MYAPPPTVAPRVVAGKDAATGLKRYRWYAVPVLKLVCGRGIVAAALRKKKVLLVLSGKYSKML